MYRAERYLEGYERAVVRIKAIKEQIKHLDETIDSINIATDGQPRSTVIRSRTEDLATSLADKKAEWLEAIKEAEEQRDEILRTINRIDGSVEAEVLRLRYIVGHTNWDDIASQVHYSRYWTQVYGRRALSLIEDILDEEFK